MDVGRLPGFFLAGVLYFLPGLAPTAAVVPPGVELHPQQELHRGNGAEPDTLDPHRSESTTAAQILRSLYEGLVNELPNGAPEPGVAKRWEVDASGKIYTFFLRTDARWSNGDPVTAQDFVAGMRRTVGPKVGSAYSQILSPIVNVDEIIAGRKKPQDMAVTAIDDYRLQIELKAPTPFLLGLLSHSATYPIHRPSVKKWGEKFSRAGRLVGNGAYTLTEWVVNDRIKVVRNPRYWDNANVVIDAVYYHPIEEQSTELKRYRANELDWTNEIPNSQFRWIQKNLPGEARIGPQLSTYYYGFNLTRPPFKGNPKLRKALSMAIDRDIIAGKVVGVGEIPAWSWVPPGVLNYTAQVLSYKDLPRQQRLAEARRLYAEAGYSADNPLETEIRYNTSENHKKIAIAVQQMWKKNLGVKATLLNEEWKVFLENRKTKVVTQVFRDGWNGDYNDAYTFLELLHSNHELNDPGYSNPVYDRLVEAAAREADTDKRRELMQQAEKILLEDHAMIPIYHYVVKHLVKPWVGGYEHNIMDHFYNKNFYIIKH